ncbi:hypothetical protein ACFW9N_44330 [Streptomyces sp. NPDC059496]|uniref:hypothetical protein n=1 Tax=Streptomyces sp. NPDC059496 TaxID=3346851 RepID=UPI0036AD7AEB
MSQVFVAPGQDARGDQQTSDVAGRGILRQVVEQFVGDGAVVVGEVGQKAGGLAAVEPGQYGVGVLCAGEDAGQRRQLGGNRTAVAGEEIVDAVGEGAAVAPAAAQKVGRLPASGAPPS